MLDNNQIYSNTNQVITKAIKPKIDALSKLTLFSIQKNNSDGSQNEEFLELLNSSVDVFYFRLRKSSNLILLEIFAPSDTLHGLVKNKVKPSKFDYLLWPENWQLPPKLLIFDMDSTFIQIEVIDELAKRHGVGSSVAEVTDAAMRGELDFSESLISRVACLEGLLETTIADICCDLPLSIGVERLVESTHQQGVKVVIVSGGFMPFVENIKKNMDPYQVKANDLQVVSGRLTGELAGAIVDAKAKADYVVELAEKLDLKMSEIITIGDGANDLQMMEKSGFSLAYRAKPAVQAKASGRMNTTNLNHLIDVFNW
ncbi:MAG: phosphoserine phosphatase SerB [Kangiellaceae bacterium]|nr:phosphoserine phosphatase SerB [Kangiellaceae bacterium]